VKNFLPPEEGVAELEVLEKLIEKQVESKILNADIFVNKDGNYKMCTTL